MVRVCLFAILLLADPVAAAMFTVETTVDDADAPDANPGDGTCADALGFCTLRAAIEESNARAGPDVIEFSIAGEFDLALGPLPTITETVVIDGRTAPGYNTGGATLADSPPVITLDGSALSGSSADGLRFSGAAAVDSEVRALSIVGFPDNGISVAAGADGLRLEGCFIGLSPAGAARGNGGDGLFAFDTEGLVIGRIYGFFTSEFLELGNAIGANGGAGINLFAVDGTTVFGNYIGADPLSGGLRGNGGIGVSIVGNDNAVGSSDADENAGNIVVGSGSDGIVIRGDDNQIRANRVGVLSETVDGGNAGDGIVVIGNRNAVGGAEPRLGNHVSGNVNGIRLGRDAQAAAQTSVQRNEIGWLEQGSGNAGDGVHIDVGTGNEVGFNLVVHNGGRGVFVGDSGNSVIGNEIGVGGDVAAGNGGEGIGIDADTTGNVVGGSTPELGNTIGDNGGAGSLFAGIGVRGSGHDIRHNAIGVTRSGADVGNAYAGIDVFAENIAIEDNWIGFNDDAGVRVRLGGSLVGNNWIGVLPTGRVAGNAGSGVVVGGLDQTIGPDNRIRHNGGAGIITLSGTSGLVVSGNDVADHPLEGIALIDAAGRIEDNRLRFNRNGVSVLAASSAQVVANRMYGNLFLAIDVGGDGASANDAGDGDGGPNLGMNHPEISAALHLPGTQQVEVAFRVDSSSASHAYPLRIDAYATDREEAMQGRYWLGTASYGSPGVSISRTFDLPDEFITGGVVALTATDAGGNTSELSAPRVFGRVDKLLVDGFEFP